MTWSGELPAAVGHYWYREQEDPPNRARLVWYCAGDGCFLLLSQEYRHSWNMHGVWWSERIVVPPYEAQEDDDA